MNAEHDESLQVENKKFYDAIAVSIQNEEDSRLIGIRDRR